VLSSHRNSDRSFTSWDDGGRGVEFAGCRCPGALFGIGIGPQGRFSSRRCSSPSDRLSPRARPGLGEGADLRPHANGRTVAAVAHLSRLPIWRDGVGWAWTEEILRTPRVRTSGFSSIFYLHPTSVLLWLVCCVWERESSEKATVAAPKDGMISVRATTIRAIVAGVMSDKATSSTR